MHQAYKKAAVLAIITLLGWGGIHSYYRYTQDMIYQESTDSLRATYTQVGTSFRLFTQRNWNILSVYEKNIQLLPAEYRTDEQWMVLLGERSQWMYRDFYLFDQAGNYVTDRGSRGLLVCQTYVTPCLMKSWSVSFGDFHPSGRIGKQL